jgi:hypothetical protein
MMASMAPRPPPIGDTARAGWCWREVLPADAASLEGAPREAWVTHSLEGLAGRELAAAAAVELVGGGDGYLNGERRAAMEAAFHATNELRNAVDQTERSWFAFRYGVALHDVERVMEQHGQRYW